MERPADGNMDAPHGFLVVLRGEQIGIEDEYRVGMDPVYTPVFQNVPLTATHLRFRNGELIAMRDPYSGWFSTLPGTPWEVLSWRKIEEEE